MRHLLTVALFIFSPAIAIAETSDRVVKAVRVSAPPVIDGYDNDAVWASASPAKDFLQRDPHEGAPATEPTEIRVVYDDHALYFFCMMHDSEPEKIVQRLARRDDEIESDYISIRIDSYHDHQNDFEFTINASGTKVDKLQYDDGDKEDNSWDPVWEVKTRVLPNGWTAEVEIPFSQLRYNPEQTEMGIEFIRTIQRKHESDYWALIKKSDNGFTSRFGRLIGLDDLPVSHHVEILPYGVANGTFLPQNSIRARRREFLPNAGLDAKYGVSSDFTVDLTFNPDFGQVEADPAVLNLSTFETIYPEKRPFFIEGTQIFHFTTFGNDPGLFYSRRIGKAITVSPPAGGMVTEEPGAATILGAAKATGKTESGFSFGALEAMTQKEMYTYKDSSGQSFTDLAAPLTNYSLARLKQDVGNGSNVGMILTNVARNGGAPASTGGIDWRLKFSDNMYAFNGFLAGSSKSDASTLQKKWGSAGNFFFGKVGGEHWLYDLAADYTSRKYDINDIGYIYRPNDHGFIGDAIYQDIVPGNVFRYYKLSYRHELRWDFDNAGIVRQGTFYWQFQFLNYYTGYAGVSYNLSAYDDRESRGYGLYRTPFTAYSVAYAQSDTRDRFIGSLLMYQGYDYAGMRYWQWQLNTDFRPTAASQIQAAAGYIRTRNKTGFADDFYTDPSNVLHSVFGHRNVDEINFTLRGSFTFTTQLSLQVYSQIFFAKGHYFSFSYLDQDQNSKIIAYDYAGNPDFNRTFLNSNIVLRWEYVPGSTIYFVWSHGSSFYEPGGFYNTLGNEFNQTFNTPPDNVFMLKVNYWLSL
ncbi:MAG: hypothetical protein KGJ59_03225 [Bacteroidota bacterium]|nr:hypothetical protein [Bacteroidota bacterium]